ncbi:MAG: M28 family peptidase [Nevskiaceae bacterium]|nr:MAG: M28 family peptidase [Nevskiaceae bacterium]
MPNTPIKTLGVAALLCLSACTSGNRSEPAETGIDAIANAAPCARSTAPEAVGMPSEARIFGWIEYFASLGNRRTGTVGGAKAAAYMKCQFESLGLQDVHYETATAMKWEVTRSSLAVAGQAIDSFPIANTFVTRDKPSVFSTGPGGLNTEIVDIGLGTQPEIALKNVKGKIVLFDLKFLVPTLGLAPLIEFFWDPGLTILDPSSLTANPFQTSAASVLQGMVDAGAVGIVGVLADYFDSNKYYNERYHLDITIPGVWVSPKDGQRIRDLMKASATPTANLVMEGSYEPTIGRAVVGALPGKSPDTILVTSHHDAVWNGAVEDGSGAASVLAQAQYFASKPAESRQKTLLFATMDTHWAEYKVHQAFGKKYIIDKKTPYNIVGDVSIEHIGKQGIKDADGKLQIVNQPEYRGIFENLGPTLKLTMINGLIKHDLRRTALLDASPLCGTVGIPTDAFSCAAGIPTASLISGPNYLYDAADTLDKVDRDQLVPVAQFFAELIEAMDATPSALIGVPVPPLSAAASGLP